MNLYRSFDGLDKKERQIKLWEGFKNNFNEIENAGHKIRYPERRFRDKGIPSPRQYIEWKKLIALIGLKNFLKLNTKATSLYENEILLFDNEDERSEIVTGNFVVECFRQLNCRAWA